MRYPIRYIALLSILASIFLTTSTFSAQVPNTFQPLYRELDEHLTAFQKRLTRDITHKPLRAASLLTVNAHVGAIMMSKEWRKTHELYLDRLRELGAEAIILEVSYPILTPRFHEISDYLMFYKSMADAIRRRGMKVVVKHNTLLPDYTTLPVRKHYQTLEKSSFGKERYVEAARIVKEIRPDYLSLVGEPGTHGTSVGLKLSEREWVGYVALVVNQLRKDLPEHRTLLGAGAGTWESPLYFEGYARIKGLDYVDLHIYPLSNGIQDYLQRAVDWSRRVRQIAPSKRVVIGEAWLYKAGSQELQKIAANKTIFSRDVYQFWEPLDVKFMMALNAMAHSERMDFWAPFWTRYFFAYLDKSPHELRGMKPDELMELSNKAAFAAMKANKTTATGKTFGRI